jgi:hypothetical protein
MRPRIWILVLAACTAALGAAMQATVSDEQVRKATEVKDRHINVLMRLPAVVGAGIAASAARPGLAAIQLYLSRPLRRKEGRRFPAELEGVPVELQVTGAFEARPRKR